MAIAGVGVILSYWSKSNPDVCAGLLRFYWFRLSDVAVPMAFSLLGCRVAFLAKLCYKTSVYAFTLLALCVCCVIGVCENVYRLANPVPPRQCRMAELGFYQWIDVCNWVDQNTPPNAAFIVPKMTRTFTWYSHRGAVVSWKDVPQDAVGLIEWHNRLCRLYVCKDNSSPTGYVWDDGLARQTPKKLKRLGKEYGADYLVTNARTPIALPVLYQNRQFTVYKLSEE